MSRETLLAILNLSLGADVGDRMASIAAKARDGILTAEENQEARLLEEASALLGTLKSKARFLYRRSSSSGDDIDNEEK